MGMDGRGGGGECALEQIQTKLPTAYLPSHLISQFLPLVSVTPAPPTTDVTVALDIIMTSLLNMILELHNKL